MVLFSITGKEKTNYFDIIYIFFSEEILFMLLFEIVIV